MWRLAHDGADRLACEIILRGAEAAGTDDDVRALQRFPDRFGQSIDVVADHRLEVEIDAQRRQPRRDVLRVRIDDLAEEDLGADGEDFCLLIVKRNARRSYGRALLLPSMLPRYTAAMRIAVIGHVEHVTIARVSALPRAGEIAHLADPVVIAGGGGGIAFFQLTKSDAEVHLFTAIGLDEAGTHVHHEIASTGATIHAGLRQLPHTRDIVVITPEGERTIFVVGEPLHPRRDDRLSWDELASCDAAYFTGQDPDTLVEARRATAVRGVVLKTEELPLEEWLDALASDLASEAQTSEEAQRALQRMLAG